MRIEEQAQIVFPFGEDDALIRGVAAEYRLVGVEAGIGGRGDAFGKHRGPPEESDHDKAPGAESACASNLLLKQPRGPERHGRIEYSENQGGSNQTESGDQQNRKQQRRTQCTEVVEREDMRNQLAKLKTLLEYAHQQRDF